MRAASATMVFVTGGSGFVGGHLIRALRERGLAVRAMARSDAAAHTVVAAGASPVAGDLSDVTAMAAGMAGCSVVFHAAARMEMWGDAEAAYRDNVVGTDGVLRAARIAGVPRLVLVSAAAVALGQRDPLVDADESTPIPKHPSSVYAGTKALAEQRVLAASGPNLATVAVRPPAIWGRGDNAFLPGLAAAVRRRRFVWVAGGRYPYSTCHVRNVCRGAILAAERGTGGAAYFLTDGAPVEFRDFATALLATQGITAPVLSVPRPIAAGFARLAEAIWRAGRLRGEPPLTRTLLSLIGGPLTISDRRAREELGYVPGVSMSSGLQELTEARGSLA